MCDPLLHIGLIAFTKWDGGEIKKLISKQTKDTEELELFKQLDQKMQQFKWGVQKC